MTQTASSTPKDITIHPRNQHFELSEALEKDWCDNDPVITAFYNAMSMTFPLGEKFFIDTVRAFAEDINDVKLREDIRGFCGQEGFHRREHQRYNEYLCEARGYDLEQLEAGNRRRIDYGWKHQSELDLLSSTTAAEHITAIFADALLRNEHLLAGADPVMRELWRWHSSEEIEHKAVAFDVFTAMGGTRKQRILAMLEVSSSLSTDVLSGIIHMLKRDDQLWNFGAWKRGSKYLLGKRGLLRQMWPGYKEFFRAGFHPWMDDNQALLNEYRDSDKPVAEAA